MAKVLYTRLGRAIKRDAKNDKHFLVGSINSIFWADGTVGFVTVVHWDKDIDVDCVEFFVVTDEERHILDQTPRIANRFQQLPASESTAILYVAFPHPGRYRIDLYQNDIRTHTFPLDVVESHDVDP